jgi:hypothetical protein
MPPVMMIGVMISARSPISTLSRVISKRITGRRKVVAGKREQQTLDGYNNEQDPLIVRKEPCAPVLLSPKRDLWLRDRFVHFSQVVRVQRRMPTPPK